MRMPQLPVGYHAQAEYEFRDPSGMFSYEFSRVYGPSSQNDARGPVCQVDEGLCYWRITGDAGDDGEDRAEGAAINFQRARATRGGRMTFGQFSSELYMRSALHGLLKR